MCSEFIHTKCFCAEQTLLKVCTGRRITSRNIYNLKMNIRCSCAPESWGHPATGTSLLCFALQVKLFAIEYSPPLASFHPRFIMASNVVLYLAPGICYIHSVSAKQSTSTAGPGQLRRPGRGSEIPVPTRSPGPLRK